MSYPDIATTAALVRPLAKAMSAEGVPVPAQLRVFQRVLGVSIGGGGTGRDETIPECAYCHAKGGGGHGGFCPDGWA
jgi:hypothetical protein